MQDKNHKNILCAKIGHKTMSDFKEIIERKLNKQY
jgi:hypothetical protein